MPRIRMNDKIRKHLELKAFNDNYFFENEFTLSELHRICNAQQVDIERMQAGADIKKWDKVGKVTKKIKQSKPTTYAEYLKKAGLTNKVNRYL